MSQAPRQRLSALTIGSLQSRDRGINLRCTCGHRTALLPAQIAAMAHPETRILDFKRRFRCSMCGASGAGDDIRLTLFDVAAPFIDGNAARPEALQPKRAPNYVLRSAAPLDHDGTSARGGAEKKESLNHQAHQDHQEEK